MSTKAILLMVLTTGAACAADIDIPKQDVITKVIPAGFAHALKLVVAELPSKYEVTCDIECVQDKTRVTVTGDISAIAVVRQLLDLQEGKQPSRGERLKQIVAKRREVESRPGYLGVRVGKVTIQLGRRNGNVKIKHNLGVWDDDWGSRIAEKSLQALEAKERALMLDRARQRDQREE